MNAVPSGSIALAQAVCRFPDTVGKDASRVSSLQHDRCPGVGFGMRSWVEDLIAPGPSCRCPSWRAGALLAGLPSVTPRNGEY
jgi:hypothetical protein